MDTILALTKRVDGRAADVADRVRALFRQDAREDPVRDREFEKLIEELVDQISSDRRLKSAILAEKPLSYKLKGRQARELTVEDGKAALAEASRIIRHQEDRKQYQTTCSAPKEWGEGQIDAFMTKAANNQDPAKVRKEVNDALLIGSTRYKGDIVATAGLKKPSLSLRRKVFELGLTTADPKRFKIQLDWITLHQDHRSKGILTDLVTEVLASAAGRPVFLLLDDGDELSREIGLQFGFQPADQGATLEQDPRPSRRLLLLPGR